ncbi:hypothetical protein [Streptomyces sp. NPDC001508]|uniref:hypothetical protein n=1 Tax=Streptomyces sp. NPDC001508 TaxID=3154656 RepID=UPI00332E3189
MRGFRDTDVDQLPASARDRRPDGVLEPFKPCLNTRTETQGQVSGTQLFLEIQARGYRGSRQVVRKHLAALRAGTAGPVRADIPSPGKTTSWIMRPPRQARSMIPHGEDHPKINGSAESAEEPAEEDR